MIYSFYRVFLNPYVLFYCNKSLDTFPLKFVKKKKICVLAETFVPNKFLIKLNIENIYILLTPAFAPLFLLCKACFNKPWVNFFCLEALFWSSLLIPPCCLGSPPPTSLIICRLFVLWYVYKTLYLCWNGNDNKASNNHWLCQRLSRF